jgi:gluconate 2-dehydrogenase gamma chain
MPVIDPGKCSRRTFAKGGLGLVVGLAAGLSSSQSLARTPGEYQPKLLTLEELAAVQAMMARLIPEDGNSGGALEACAYIYLDRALGTHLAHHVDTYRSGLAELDRLAREERSAGLAALTPAQVDAMLSRMEKGELPRERFPDGGVGFFNLMRGHTLEGFLSDPLYGGNQDFTGWKAIGYNGVQLTYPAAAQELNGRDERTPLSVASFGGTALP